ncbi:MAG TPA: alpha-glucan family phosphorylase [Bryobacteraceae bacterium]|nr:alpha-glucan family phosphorylase [Bryobacteraceae bacterium]
MSFDVRPLREFLVRPTLPPALDRLPELGSNLMWSWNHGVRAVFRRLDPAAWKESNRNPVVMLGRVSQAALERAAADPRFLALYRRACDILDAYLASSPSSNMLTAYFSMEYGLLDCMPIYSGGLGVLSGDHLKASSDAMVPLAGVGLLYQNGYLQQSLDPDGWQQERTPVNDFYSLPVTPLTKQDGAELLVSVPLGHAEVFVKAWRIDVGRVKLYLLDTNIPQNAAPEHREITNQLYGGDVHTRIRQEIVLGIGGLRVLEELQLKPTVFHMNEGHSAFLAIERIRVLMAEQNLPFEEALYASRGSNVFTTHTSVPAGLDIFDPAMIHEYFGPYCERAGIPFDRFLALGRRGGAEHHEAFSMAICAIQTSSFRNAVSRLHRRVSQEMWEGLWPNLPVWEVPITSITNGVHLTSWINGDLANLYDQYLTPDWREGHAEPEMWNQTADIPVTELWEAHRRRKRRLVSFVRERVGASAAVRNAPAAEIERAKEVLDAEAFTIGFARRFATYKRATLIFRDVARLKRILTNEKMPVQIVIAGKAHPRDVPGKTLIREIAHFSRDPELAGRIVFVEDYGMEVAGELVQGVDLWLNTPRRGEEACGTSGMKAGVNGVLSLSSLDGWFDEAAENSGGWAIGDREPYSPDRDDAHATAIYSLLEHEIVPLYYEAREHGVPMRWMRRVRQCLRYVSAHFNSQRMVGEYSAEFYEPAHRKWEETVRDGFAAARDYVRWAREVEQRWPGVAFTEPGTTAVSPVLSGSTVPLRSGLDLAGLTPRDVRVEAVVGRVGPRGELVDTQVLTLDPLEQHGNVYLFGRDFAPLNTGRLGYAVRVTPNHCEDPLNRPCNAPFKWMNR